MTDSSDEDLEQRGRAIFDRLRSRVVGPPEPEIEDPAPAVEPMDASVPVLVDDPVTSDASPDADSEPERVSILDEPAAIDAPAPTTLPPDAEDRASVPEPAVDRAPPPDPALNGAPATREPEPAAAEEPAVEPEPAPFARDLPRVVAIANQKGGVGKTTTAINLSSCLAELGYRVLVVDLDPQGNATTGLGINPRNLSGSMYDVLLNDRGLDDVVEATSVRNLFVAPSSLDLAGAEIELVPAFSRELKLRRAVEEVLDDFDFVIVDCPPSLGLLTVNGLAAAHEVLVPIQCEYYALEGLGQLLRNVTMVQQNLNPRLEVSAIVLVMYDARTKLAGEVVSEVRGYFGEKVCRTVVPRTVRLSEAPSFGQPINAFDPSSRGAIAYRALAKEFSGGTPHRVG